MDDKPFDVLLVDDSDDDVLIVQESFKKGNILNPLKLAKDGRQALDYLRKQGPYSEAKTPGLVLMDIKMPRMDGFQVLEEMLNDDALKHIPVVMLTTSSQERDIVKSYRHGACSYIQKPVGLDNFRKVVADLMFYWTITSKVPGTGR